MKERILSIIMSMVVLISFMPSVRVFSANVEETSGTQLQTILIDNDG